MGNSVANSMVDFRAQKRQMRDSLKRSRAAMSVDQRSGESRLIREHVLQALYEFFVVEGPRNSDGRGKSGGRGSPSWQGQSRACTVASYLARDDEPDPETLTLRATLGLILAGQTVPQTTDWSLWTQTSLAEGRNASKVTNLCVASRVLVPRLTDLAGAQVGAAGRLVPWWSWLDDQAAPGWHGIPEATGRGGLHSDSLPASILREAQVILVPGLAGGRDGSRLGRGGGWYDEALRFASVDAQIWLLLFSGELFDEVPTEPHDVRVTSIFTPAGRVRV